MAARTSRGWRGSLKGFRHPRGPIIAPAGPAPITFRYFPLPK